MPARSRPSRTGSASTPSIPRQTRWARPGRVGVAVRGSPRRTASGAARQPVGQPPGPCRLGRQPRPGAARAAAAAPNPTAAGDVLQSGPPGPLLLAADQQGLEAQAPRAPPGRRRPAGRRACGRDSDTRSAPSSSEVDRRAVPGGGHGVDVDGDPGRRQSGDHLGHRLDGARPRGWPTGSGRGPGHAGLVRRCGRGPRPRRPRRSGPARSTGRARPRRQARPRRRARPSARPAGHEHRPAVPAPRQRRPRRRR